MESYTVNVTLNIRAENHGDAVAAVESRLCPAQPLDERRAVVRDIDAKRTPLAELRKRFAN